MKYMVYCYEPLNDDSMCCMIHFEPFLFENEEEAKKNAAIFKMLRHNDFYCISYDCVKDYFDNLFVDVVPSSSFQSIYECD